MFIKKIFRKILKLFFLLKKYILNLPNKLYIRYLRCFNNNLTPTIISNNCWCGGIYEDLGLEYMSPTVGLYLNAPCYIKFISNLRYYIDLDLKFTHISRYNGRCEYPIGLLDDIEIHFLHYKSEKDAYDKWNRRKQRINYDNLFIKFCDNDYCTDEHVIAFSKLNYKKR